MEEGRSDDGNNAGKIMAAEWSCDERTRALSRNNAPAFAPLLLLLLSLSLLLFIYLPPPLSLSLCIRIATGEARIAASIQ